MLCKNENFNDRLHLKRPSQVVTTQKKEGDIWFLTFLKVFILMRSSYY